MSTSTGTLTKTIPQDYKIMGNGSFESIDKSVLSSEASFEPFENHRNGEKSEYQTPKKSQNEYVTSTVRLGSSQAPQRVATIGSASKASASRGRAAVAAWSEHKPSDFELSYRNEGFRDNSTYSGTRNNSISNSITEDTPIIHQTDIEETGSDYYGNANTLPLRHDPTENLAFLSELKKTIPEQQRTSTISDRPPSSFLPPTNNTPSPTTQQMPRGNNSTLADSLTYEQKIDNLNFSSLAELRSHNNSQVSNATSLGGQPAEPFRRPDSYLTAVGANRLSRPVSSLAKTPKYDTPTANVASRRPKTVYESDDNTNKSIPSHAYQQRSRSEALLETDLDIDNAPTIDTNGRSHSQPLETSM